MTGRAQDLVAEILTAADRYATSRKNMAVSSRRGDDETGRVMREDVVHQWAEMAGLIAALAALAQPIADATDLHDLDMHPQPGQPGVPLPRGVIGYGISRVLAPVEVTG